MCECGLAILHGALLAVFRGVSFPTRIELIEHNPCLSSHLVRVVAVDLHDVAVLREDEVQSLLQLLLSSQRTRGREKHSIRARRTESETSAQQQARKQQATRAETTASSAWQASRMWNAAEKPALCLLARSLWPAR